MSFNNIITVDIGNTKTKFCLRTSLKDIFFIQKDLNQILKDYSLNSNNTKVLISSVKSSLNIEGIESLDLKSFYKNKLFFNMPVDYNETIGIDRLICSFWAYNKKKKSILIDTGTFTTIDIVDSKGFSGGYILVGLELLKEAYNNGEKLKDFNPKTTNDLSLANTSKDAIDRGLTISYLSSIQKIISAYKDHEVIITGGNGEILESLLSHQGYKLEFKENLIHESMQLIGKEYL
jgi:pantothenate kinase type III